MRRDDGAGAPVDADIRDRGAVRLHVGAEADAATGDDVAARARRCGAGRPSRRLRYGVENRQPARVGHVAPAELQRVDTRHVRELVERLLGREGERDVERRPQVRRLEIAVDARHPMVVQAQVRDVVHRPQRHLVEVPRRPVGRFPGRRAERQLLGRLDRRPDVLPAVVFVCHDPAVGIDAGFHVGKMRRPEVVPAVLVGPGELHAHRRADLLRHDRRRLRRIVIAAAAERAGALEVLDAYVHGRDAEDFCHLVARAVDALRRAHHRGAGRRDVGDGAVRAERHVSLIRSAKRRLDHVRGAAEGGGDIALFRDHGICRLRRAHLIEEASRPCERRRDVPRHLQLLCGAHGVPLVRRDNREKVAPADDADAGNVRDGRLVEAGDACAVGVRALPGRPHDASVQHARQPDVLHVRVLAADLVREVEPRMASADDRVLGRSFLRGRAGQRDLERLVAKEIAVLHGLRPVAGNGDDAFRHRELIGWNAQPARGQRQQRLTRFGSRRPDLRTAALDRRARDGGALIRRHVRVEPHRGDLAHVEVELLGGNLQQRGARALAELDVADVGRRGVVGVNRDPRVDEFLIGRARHGGARGGGGSLLRECHVAHAEADHHGAAGFQELAPGKRQRAQRRASAIVAAAR